MAHPLRRAVMGTGAQGPARNDDTAARNAMAGRDSGVPARSVDPRRAARSRGETRMFYDSEGQLHEVQEARQASNVAANEDSAQPSLFNAFNYPMVSQVRYPSSREFCLQAYVNSPSDDPGQNLSTGGGANVGASPFLVDPSIVGTTVVGGCVALGKLVYGHDGVSRTSVINLANGQSTKLSVIGSAAAFSALMTIKYWTPDDTDPVERFYTVGAAGPLTSERFSNPTQADFVPVIGGDPTQANILDGNSATCLAYVTRATAASSGGTTPKAARRFFGMLRVGGANAKRTNCPVQTGCSHVLLQAPESFQFFQVNASIPGNPILTAGPFPANIPIILEDNVDHIAVESNLPIVAHEHAFSLYYFPGY